MNLINNQIDVNWLTEPNCFAKTFAYSYIPMWTYFDIYLSSGHTLTNYEEFS